MLLDYVDIFDKVIETSSPLGIFLSYVYLFIIGSMLGYIGEVFFRRFFSMKRWINPGFLKGPYLPLYGFGLDLLHLISSISFKYICNGEQVPSFYPYEQANGSLNFWWTTLVVVCLIGIGMTLLEFIAGIIFVKGFNIKLWDYSSLKGNIMGVICPLFSLIWLVIGVLYWFLIRPFVLGALTFFDEHVWGLTYAIGIFSGVVLVDFINSMKLSFRISETAKKNNFVVDFEKLKINMKKKDVKAKNKSTLQLAVEEAASILKTKLGKLTYDVKKHMYINNELPKETAATIDETPRMKAKRLKKEEENKTN